jgi:hypothetical protein
MGNEDIWYEVEAVHFSIDEGKWFTIGTPHGAGRREISRIFETTLENQ